MVKATPVRMTYGLNQTVFTCLDGRFIPSRDDSTRCMNYGEPVIGIHSRINMSVGFVGCVLGVDVE